MLKFPQNSIRMGCIAGRLIFLDDSICFGCFFTVERRGMMMDLLQYLFFFSCN